MSSVEETSIVQPGDPESISKNEYNIDDYVEHFSRLVNLEREEEMKRHQNEIKHLSGREREKRGRAILHAKARKEGTGLGGKIFVKFVRKEGLPETEISVGDLVRISKNKLLSDDNPSGTVIEKTGYSVKVAFENKPPAWMYDKVRVDLYVNDITFQRMLNALQKLKSLSGKKKQLLDKLLTKKQLRIGKEGDLSFFNEKLNQSQREAVKKAAACNFFYLIHGPPGTGKTVTCIEVIEQEIAKGKKVLACADSNTAVDNLVEHLVSRGRKVVRVGHPARVTPILRGHTLDIILEKNDVYKKAQGLREKAYHLKEKQEKYTYPSGKWRRGLSNKAIKNLAEKGKSSRGIPPKKIKEMSKSISIQEKIDDIFDRIDNLEEKAVNEVIENADVVCTTNSSSASRALEEKEFDICVIDEATQATEPSCLIPIIKSKKLVMAGDHKQLPPTILNEKAKNMGLSNTLFERLISLYGKKIKTLIQVQYRMNKKIMNFSNHLFYDGKLNADESVKYHTLQDLIKKQVDFNSPYKEIIDPSTPITLIDTSGRFPERTRKDSTSKENPGEAKLARNIVEKILKKGTTPEDIGIITPYDDQKDLLISKIDQERIEIDTVDGFQGREKEIIILSLTRSNSEKNIGFLRDLRRLNVSITRARRKLIVIADIGTISNNKIYNQLFNYIADNGLKIEI